MILHNFSYEMFHNATKQWYWCATSIDDGPSISIFTQPQSPLQNTFQGHALIYNIVETNLKCFDQIGAWNSLGVLSSILLIVWINTRVNWINWGRRNGFRPRTYEWGKDNYYGAVIGAIEM